MFLFSTYLFIDIFFLIVVPPGSRFFYCFKVIINGAPVGLVEEEEGFMSVAEDLAADGASRMLA